MAGMPYLKYLNVGIGLWQAIHEFDEGKEEKLTEIYFFISGVGLFILRPLLAYCS
jgi:hypothetical protein